MNRRGNHVIYTFDLKTIWNQVINCPDKARKTAIARWRRVLSRPLMEDATETPHERERCSVRRRTGPPFITSYSPYGLVQVTKTITDILEIRTLFVSEFLEFPIDRFNYAKIDRAWKLRVRKLL